jgi:K+-transporting ATPase ATPase A chain
MTLPGILQIAAYFVVLTLLVKPLGAYMARVYQGQRVVLARILGPLERLIYRLSGVKADQETGWKGYALAMLLFNVAGFVLVYLLQRLQGILPLNPQGMGAVSADSSFNTAVSFATNTNWQGYGGETTMSYLTQMLALTVQNFVSAATGMAVLVALIRGFARHTTETIGNFWVDLTRSTLYILLPLSLILSIALVSQGVVQTLSPSRTVTLVQPTTDADGKTVTEQTLAVGPVASQIAIKQLGTNGGGFFNVNSAHPFENPTPFSDFLELLSILLIAAALTYTFGTMVGDTRQGWALYATMLILVVGFLALAYTQEAQGNPALAKLGVDQAASGNMEGKEVRFGVANSALWATTTTAASNGSVNSMHDSFTPLGGMVPIVMMMLGEVAFGGVGSGLYGMLGFVIVAVFVAGLMVGRTPEYLGKKIEAYEMKMASLLVLIMPITVLALTALAVLTGPGKAAVFNPGPHGFSEILYWLAVPALALAGSLARKKKAPAGTGTLPTHTPLFVAWLIAVVILVGALNFFPALALGPMVEHLVMLAG